MASLKYLGEVCRSVSRRGVGVARERTALCWASRPPGLPDWEGATETETEGPAGRYQRDKTAARRSQLSSRVPLVGISLFARDSSPSANLARPPRQSTPAHDRQKGPSHHPPARAPPPGSLAGVLGSVESDVTQAGQVSSPVEHPLRFPPTRGGRGRVGRAEGRGVRREARGAALALGPAGRVSMYS